MGDNHVIVLVIDALCQEMMNRSIGRQEVMPFLRSSLKSGTSWNRVYSCAPYTEASLVSLLGREKTLTSGGYLYGNAVCSDPLPKIFKQSGYVTLGTFSPYVYSKAYLNGFDCPFHTRLFDINPLFNYRIRQLSDLFIHNEDGHECLCTAAILLNEAIETWLTQLELLISEDKSVELLAPFLSERVDLPGIRCKLTDELVLLRSNPNQYAKSCFDNLNNNRLRQLNEVYRTKPVEPADFSELRDAFGRRVDSLQARYTKLTRKNQACDFKYLASTLLFEQSGWSKFKGLVHNYMRLHSNRYLSLYFDSLDAEPKYEASLRSQMLYSLEQIRDYDANGKKTFTYVHAQDFHLPSVFHQTDTRDCEVMACDLRKACELLEKMDESYKGNILADLSASYVDQMICDFKNRLDCLVPGGYTLIVTADHGYPSLYDPPRPKIYNQTYSEAFHVPFCIFGNTCDGYSLPNCNQPIDNLSIFNHLWVSMGILDEAERSSELSGFVLTEHGGPGCPNLGHQNIWYTYIDNDYRVSAQCMLGDVLSYPHITDVFDLRNDRRQTQNLHKSQETLNNVAHCVEKIAERHREISRSVARNRFLADFYQIECISEDYRKLYKDAQYE